MAENNPNNIEDLGDDLGEGTENVQKIDPKVLETAERAGAAKYAAQVMKEHPEIAQLLAIKAEGKKAKVLSEEQVTQTSSQSSQQEEPPPNFDEMTEHQKHQYLIKQMVKETEKVIDRKIGEKLSPVQEQLQGLSGFATALQKKDAISQIEQLKKEFKDFEKHAPRMAELAGENPNLNARQLYILAAQEAGVLTRSERRTASERPTNTTARPAGGGKKEVTVSPGFGGLRDLISQSAAKNVRSLNISHDDSDDE